jgi:hypothetical protein
MWYNDVIESKSVRSTQPINQAVQNNQEHSNALLVCSKRKEVNHEDMYEMWGISK